VDRIDRAPRRLGVIGCGSIGLPVVEACAGGALPGWALGGVLTRSGEPAGVTCPNDTDPQVFLGRGYDLIVEAAGPAALAAHGARALAVADVWSVSGAALADAALAAALEAAGRRSGHRLRLLSGAIAGLDGVAMACADPEATLAMEIDLPPAPGPQGVVFSGTAREAARRFPDGVNIAVAAALAGPGLDRAHVVVNRGNTRHRLALSAIGGHARVLAAVEPQAAAPVHPVAACILACLRRETQTIWAG
jgi:aspartate dehydrogenase